ncbi:MAG: phosphate ABC transporter substrate-binding/OmpA family protein [Pseudomonadota bacterium]
MMTRLTCVLAILVAFPLFAGPVRLTSESGGVTIEGDLVSRTGELFRLQTNLGLVTIDAGMMTCSGAGCPDPSELAIKASVVGSEDIVHRLFPALLEAYAASRGLSLGRTFVDDQNVSWQLTIEGSDRLLGSFDVKATSEREFDDMLVNGEATLGLSQNYGSADVKQDVVALDALVPAVAPDNPRAMVTLDQLKGLLRGDTRDWARLGGSNDPVTLHLSANVENDLSAFGLSDVRDDAVLQESNRTMADIVATDPTALGLLPYSELGNSVPLVISGACGLATPPTRDTIRAEDYPLTRQIFLQRVGSDQPKLVREFIAFSRSAAVQPLIRAAGFVDQAISEISFEQQGGRIANAVLAAGQDPDAIADVQAMIGTLLNGARLTLTFRFEDGSSALDPQSVSNIQRLADAIADGAFEGSNLLFVGFSDGIGEKDANLRLSERRAQSVRRAVSARASDSSVALEVAAFGELMPMACDDTPWGGRVNRRVEVWVKPSEVTR